MTDQAQSKNNGLRQQHEVLKAVMDGIDDVIYVSDPQSYELLHVNEAFEKSWGAGVVGKKCYRVLQNRDSPCPFCTNDKIFGEHLGKAHVWEFQNEVTKSWYRCSDKAIRWVDGRMVRFELASDITAIKRTAEALRESEDLNRTLVASIPLKLFLKDRRSRYLMVNEHYAADFDATPEEFVGKDDFAFYPADLARKYRDDDAEVMAAATVKDLEESYMVDGQQFWVHTIKAPVADDEGEIVALLGLFEDITERKKFEAELRIKDAFFEGSMAAHSTADATGAINLVNNAFLELWGYASKKEALGNSVADFFVNTEDAGPVLEALNGVGTWKGEFLGKKQSGERFISRGFATAIRDDHGEIVGYQSTNLDVTLEREAEARLSELVEALKRSNAELEQFAYVASHDLQEPLRMVASYTQLLADRYEGKLDEKADKYIGYAVEGATRMQGLINDLLAYSRVGTKGEPVAPVDCKEVVDEVLRRLHKAVEESGAELIVGELPTVEADHTQLGQVFQNLIANAIKFRGDAPPKVEITSRRTGEKWEIAIQDNGIGIDPQFHERVFVIFQRLHERKKYPGSGIGLAIVRKIVQRHGGRVVIDSAAGQGTRVTFTMPAEPGTPRNDNA